MALIYPRLSLTLLHLNLVQIDFTYKVRIPSKLSWLRLIQISGFRNDLCAEILHGLGNFLGDVSDAER